MVKMVFVQYVQGVFDAFATAVVSVVVGGEQQSEACCAEGRRQFVRGLEGGITGLGRLTGKRELQVANCQVGFPEDVLNVGKTFGDLVLPTRAPRGIELVLVHHDVAGKSQLQPLALGRG